MVSAKTRDLISEMRLQILKIDADFSTQLTKDLADADAQVRELTEQKRIAEDVLMRSVIRAPETGIVQDLRFFSSNAVVKPTETLLSIIPSGDKLVIEARVPPAQIDQIHVGQPAFIRFTNFNRRLTPELDSVVTFVSADLTAQGSRFSGSAESTGGGNKASDLPFYAVRLEMADDQISKLGDARLIPGMLVQAMIMTDERSVLSYLLKPIEDRLILAFREK
jgi:HlyD family secretion protein